MVGAEWDDLPDNVRRAVERCTGQVLQAHTVHEGANSLLAAVLETQTGKTFVKGLRADDHGVATQLREAVAAPLIQGFSPRLLARVTMDLWDINVFDHVDGRHAAYVPGSRDLPAVADVMRELGRVVCPALDVFKRAEQRWRGYYEDPAGADALSGRALLHTDWNACNVLMTPGGARIVDWAWATLGAAWVDPACWVLRLIAAGHSPESAERWAASVPAWHTARDSDLDAFAHANARLWSEIVAHDAGSPRIAGMGTAAETWRWYRAGRGV